MGRPSPYSPEVRERAVRMVFDHVGEYDSQWAAIRSVAGEFGCSAETLRTALDQAVYDRLEPGRQVGDLVAHSDAGRQYTAMAYTDRLADAGIAPSIGSVGDSFDNALAETIIGLYKTEVIWQRERWDSLEHVEWETMRWVSWFNHERLFGPIGFIPPAEHEANHHCHEPTRPSRPESTKMS